MAGKRRAVRRRDGPRRTIALHMPFNPDGKDVAALLNVQEFHTSAAKHHCRASAARLRQRKAESRLFMAGMRRAFPILSRYLHGGLSLDDARAEFERVLPDPALRRRVFDAWSTAVQRTPAERAREKQELAEKEKALRQEVEDSKKSRRWLKALEAVKRGLGLLHKEAVAGSSEAAKHVLAIASHTAMLVLGLEKLQPEVVREVARGQTTWPVLASVKPGWERRAARQVEALQLGANIREVTVRYRTARGAEENYPARRWAKAAVETVEMTRLCVELVADARNNFETGKAFSDFLDKGGWDLGSFPPWASDAMKLPPFAAGSAREWKPVLRQMIREQLPDFHKHADWENQRRTASASGRDTPGEIQNAILDDICSALERIAPIKEVPKSGC